MHFNSKLCLKEIHDLQQLLKTNTTEDFISTESNGYEETCVAKEITSSCNVLSSSEVEIEWERFDISKTEKIVAYIIYFIVAPERNITHLGIDSCVQ